MPPRPFLNRLPLDVLRVAVMLIAAYALGMTIGIHDARADGDINDALTTLEKAKENLEIQRQTLEAERDTFHDQINASLAECHAVWTGYLVQKRKKAEAEGSVKALKEASEDATVAPLVEAQLNNAKHLVGEAVEDMALLTERASEMERRQVALVDDWEAVKTEIRENKAATQKLEAAIEKLEGPKEEPKKDSLYASLLDDHPKVLSSEPVFSPTAAQYNMTDQAEMPGEILACLTPKGTPEPEPNTPWPLGKLSDDPQKPGVDLSGSIRGGGGGATER